MLRVMPDLSLSVLVTRDLLGLADLEINDFVNYYVSSEFLGADVSWNKNRAGSVFIDGSVAVSETRDVVTEPVTVEVLGDDGVDALANLATLREAFTQKTYELIVKVGGTEVLHYACEKANYKLGWTGARMVQGQIQAILQVPRQPLPIAGAV